ncbi:hypothetical protein HDU98_002865 [Podochytrium sp. JEL0797]|nr:hypothetical protein HDU98_002865 [Podochytrium sp. JEL0797]
MPTFQVVRCFSDTCSMYQVKQETKSTKWKCKLCGAAQSLLKVVFASGSAAECRPVVQQLNLARGEAREAAAAALPARPPPSSSPANKPTPRVVGVSKWKQFDEPAQPEPEHDTDHPTNLSFVHPSNMPQRKRDRTTATATAVKCKFDMDDVVLNPHKASRYTPNKSYISLPSVSMHSSVPVAAEFARLPVSNMSIPSPLVPRPNTPPATSHALPQRYQQPPAKMRPAVVPPAQKNSKWGAFVDEEEQDDSDESD